MTEVSADDPDRSATGVGDQTPVIEVSADAADDPDHSVAGVGDQTPVIEVSADAADDPDHRQLVSVTRLL